MDNRVLNVNKPAPMPVVPNNIPLSLRQLRRWVCWSWTPRRGGAEGWDKPPFDVHTGGHASSTDPATWADFDHCYDAYRRGEYDGVGIMLGHVEETGLTLAGVDFDWVRDPMSGLVEPWAEWAIRRLDSYAEISPSWKGIKALCWGQVPTGRKADHERGVEMYDRARYWTVTGKRYSGARSEVMNRAEVLRQLHAEFLGEKTPRHSMLNDREIALSALAALSGSRAVSYSDWLGVGMCLHSADASEAMCIEWDRWSRQAADKYEEGACARKWKTFSAGGGLSLGSLIHWAKLDGWVPPTAKATTASSPLTAKQQLLSQMDILLHEPDLARTFWRILRNAEKGDFDVQ